MCIIGNPSNDEMEKLSAIIEDSLLQLLSKIGKVPALDISNLISKG